MLSFAVLSAGWVLLLYWRALLNPFSSYDDLTIIVNNPGLATWHGVLYYLHTNVSFVGDLKGSGESYYRPLSWVSLALDRKLWGLHPFGFHLTNLLLHWADGLLLFALLRKLRTSWRVAGCAALIWLALPINSEAVAWIAARAYCLAALFVLASGIFAVRCLEGRRVLFFALYALAALCGLFSHESGILVLPLTVLVAYALKKAAARAAMALYAIAIAAALFFFGLRHLLGGGAATSQHGAVLPAGLFYFKYLAWLALPLHMSMERSTNTPADHFSMLALLAWVGLLGFVAAALLLRRRQPVVAAGLAWMTVALLPFCGVVPIYQGMAERFLYFASAGFALLVAAALFAVPRRARPVAFALVAVWVLWGGLRLHLRLLDWGDPVRLYRSSLEASPRSVKLHYNLGAVSEQRGNLVQADLSYHSVLRLDPAYEPAIAGLGNVRLRLNDPKGAVKLYQKALAIRPDDLGALTNYAASLVELGELEQAEKQYRRAIALAPTKDDGYCGLGVLLFQEGNPLGAAVQFMKAQRVDPSDATPNYDLGAVYQSLGRLDAAAELFHKALELKPGDPDATKALRQIESR